MHWLPSAAAMCACRPTTMHRIWQVWVGGRQPAASVTAAACSGARGTGAFPWFWLLPCSALPPPPMPQHWRRRWQATGCGHGARDKRSGPAPLSATLLLRSTTARKCRARGAVAAGLPEAVRIITQADAGGPAGAVVHTRRGPVSDEVPRVLVGPVGEDIRGDRLGVGRGLLGRDIGLSDLALRRHGRRLGPSCGCCG